MFSLTEITSALHARKIGTRWLARCPAHEDRSPSLSICEKNGRILIHCFSGCEQRDVITALRSLGLWPKSPKTGEHRVTADDDWRDDARRVVHWRHAARVLTEWLLDQIPANNPDRLPLTRLLDALRIMSDVGLVGTYREYRRRDPKFTAAMVRAGRLSIARIEERFAEWLVRGMTHE